VSAESADGFYFGEDVPINLDNVQCTDLSTSISDCDHNVFGDNDCEVHDFDVGLVCTNDPLVPECEEFAMRLVDGDGEDSTATGTGRVEICQNGVW